MKPISMLITHDDLVKRAKKWLKDAHGSKFACGVVLSEYNCTLSEVPDVIGFNSHRSILIECKVSRVDFKSDKYKPHRRYIKRLGNLRYYLTLPSVACPEDISDGWGLLYATADKIMVIKEAEWFNDDSVKAAEWSLLYSIARRLEVRGLLQDVQKPLTEVCNDRG